MRLTAYLLVAIVVFPDGTSTETEGWMCLPVLVSLTGTRALKYARNYSL